MNILYYLISPFNTRAVVTYSQGLIVEIFFRNAVASHFLAARTSTALKQRVHQAVHLLVDRMEDCRALLLPDSMGALSKSVIFLFSENLVFLLCHLSLRVILHALCLWFFSTSRLHSASISLMVTCLCFQIYCLISFSIYLACLLALIFLLSGSILRHWHADCIMDPLANQWALHIKGGLALLLGPSWPVLALIR